MWNQVMINRIRDFFFFNEIECKKRGTNKIQPHWISIDSCITKEKEKLIKRKGGVQAHIRVVLILCIFECWCCLRLIWFEINKNKKINQVSSLYLNFNLCCTAIQVSHLNNMVSNHSDILINILIRYYYSIFKIYKYEYLVFDKNSL